MNPRGVGIMSPQAIRDSLMEGAGITLDVKKRIVRKVVCAMVKKLQAKKKQVISHLGVVTAVIEVEDNMAQLRAAEGLALLMGIEPSKDVNATSVRITVDVQLPDWAKPALDVTQAPLDREGILDVTPQK